MFDAQLLAQYVSEHVLMMVFVLFTLAWGALVLAFAFQDQVRAEPAKARDDGRDADESREGHGLGTRAAFSS